MHGFESHCFIESVKKNILIGCREGCTLVVHIVNNWLWYDHTLLIEISGFQERFQDFKEDFRISRKISGFRRTFGVLISRRFRDFRDFAGVSEGFQGKCKRFRAKWRTLHINANAVLGSHELLNILNSPTSVLWNLSLYIYVRIADFLSSLNVTCICIIISLTMQQWDYVIPFQKCWKSELALTQEDGIYTTGTVYKVHHYIGSIYIHEGKHWFKLRHHITVQHTHL